MAAGVSPMVLEQTEANRFFHALKDVVVLKEVASEQFNSTNQHIGDTKQKLTGVRLWSDQSHNRSSHLSRVSCVCTVSISL